jgi:hypothetical protein
VWAAAAEVAVDRVQQLATEQAKFFRDVVHGCCPPRVYWSWRSRRETRSRRGLRRALQVSRDFPVGTFLDHPQPEEFAILLRQRRKRSTLNFRE